MSLDFFYHFSHSLLLSNNSSHFLYTNDRRQHPYRRGGGRNGDGGRRQPGNRFENTASTKSVDPQSAMLKQLTAMVAKMGDLISCAETAASLGLDSSSESASNNEPVMRGVVKAISKNIQDLVVVLCTPVNASLFLKFGTSNGEDIEKTVINAEDLAGPLATLVTSCSATLPLQSPSYVGLTLGVEEHAPDASTETGGVSYKGFAQRCVTMASLRLASDLDKACGVISLLSKESDGSPGEISKADESIQAFMRAKLLLRYFALLSRAGILSSTEVGDEDISTASNFSSLSLGGLLQLLTDSADRAKKSSDGSKSANISSSNASILLSALILSTIPYSLHVLSKEFVDGILTRIDSIIEGYESPFKPGAGVLSILLEKAQNEDFAVEMEEEEDEDSDDDDDNEGSPVCADSFQDLVRSVRKLVDTYYTNEIMPSKFALLSDSPWQGLTSGDDEYAPLEGDTEDEIEKRKNAANILSYKGEKLHIAIPDTCHLFRHLLGVSNLDVNLTPVTLLCPSTEGIIYGRLSIFDPPPEDDDDEEDNSSRNPSVDAYVKSFSLLDRFLLSESIRDCLICHRAIVSDTGAERGSAKDAAEQIWAVSQLFLSSALDNNNTVSEASKGVECGIVETILSLIVQSPRGIESASPMGHIYLSRVLIELAKAQPTRIPQSLAFAISDLFNDFMPSFSPVAKENLSHWFAYHLMNTDYQWPQAYWNAWAPYVVEGMQGKRNSRGEFITQAIEIMVSFVSNPATIASDCLPVQSKLTKYLVGGADDAESESKSMLFLSALETVEKDIKERMWKNSEEPEDVQLYINGEEVSETIQGSMDDDLESAATLDPEKIWWRSGLIIRSILNPASEKEYHLKQSLAKSVVAIAMEDEDDEEDPKVDVVTDITDYLVRYKPVLLATMAKDIQVHDENLDLRGESKKSESELILMGEEYMLLQCQKLTGYSSATLTTCVEVLAKEKIVSVKGVLRWLLGAEGGKGNESIASRGWWNYASLALHLAVDDLASDKISLMDGDGSDIGMIIDSRKDDGDGNSGTPSSRRIKMVTDFVSPLLQYASDRVKAILGELKDEKELSHFEADLKEGLKFFIRSVSRHIVSILKQDDIIKETTELGGPLLEVETWVTKCAYNEVIADTIS